MGNSCTREEAVALSETGIRRTQMTREAEAIRERGRWSACEGSVDLDALLEAPSPALIARRRKRGKSQSERIYRTLSRVSSTSSVSGHEGQASSERRNDRARTSSGKIKRPPSSWFRSSKSTSALDAQRDDEEESTYHSYDDPGYLSADNTSDNMTALDADLILASPLESESSGVIHARWGEPVDDPDEEEVCTDYKPNPFKRGFCINCQKQHDINANGDVETKKEYKKITRPTIAKYAANALDNPAAVQNATPRSREADEVDVAQLLEQRREILSKLGRIDLENDLNVKNPDYSARHTMFLADANTTNLANLRRMATAGQPQSLRVQRAASDRSERAPASFCGVIKSRSLGNTMLEEEEEPVPNDWL